MKKIKLLLLLIGFGLITNTISAQMQNALEFTNIYNNVIIQPNPTLDFGTGDFTIEAWIKNTNTPGLPWKRIFTKRDAGPLWYSLALNNNMLCLELTGGMFFMAGPAIQGDNQWHHMVGVRQGIRLHLYIDGIKYSNTNPAYAVNTNNNSGAEIGTLGGEAYGGETYEGQIDEIRVWNIARTDAQIRDNMYRELPSPQADPNLVLYYKCNQIFLPIVPDNSLYGNIGILGMNPNVCWVASTAPIPYQSIANGNWSAQSTWNSGQGIPENDWSNVEIKTNVNLNQDKTLNDLTIAANSSLVIEPSSELTVTNDLVNNNGTSGLVLQSEASGTASLLHTSNNVEATVGRFIPAYIGNKGWHFLSSPVASQAIKPQFVPNTNPIPGNNDFYKFDEASNYWINTKDDNGNWNTSFEDDFVIGKGYNSAYENDVSKVFTGELNGGDYTFNSSSTPAITYTVDGSQGWNLMGNPYPSAIDWDECSISNIDGAVYVYDGEAGQYISWNGTEGALSDGIIPPMNAFFIKASAGASLSIPNSSRKHTSNNFYKDEILTENLLVLQVEGNGLADEAYIRIKQNASTGFDPNFDAYKLWGIMEAPQLYTMAPDANLSINVLPFSNDEIIIPLALEVGTDAEYELIVLESSFDETVDLRLEDLETGNIYRLEKNSPIVFYQNPDDNPGRFLILINGATGLNEPMKEDDNIEIYSYGHKIIIKSNEPVKSQVSVFNLLGQIVLSQSLNGRENHQTIKLDPNIRRGFYLVTVKTDLGLKSEKIYIR